MRWLQTRNNVFTRLSSSKCNLRHQPEQTRTCKLFIASYLIVIWTICALLHACVLFLIPNLDANNGIHVESGELSSFDDCDTNLEILWFQMVGKLVQLDFRLRLNTRLGIFLLTLIRLDIVLGDFIDFISLSLDIIDWTLPACEMLSYWIVVLSLRADAAAASSESPINDLVRNKV